MQRLLACVLLVCLAVAAGHAQNASQTFQAGVDLIAIDVAALDDDGRPVEDLRPRDFEVKIDGERRDVVSAQLVRVDPGLAGVPGNASEVPLVSTNADVAEGRRVVVAVDQTLIGPGSVTPLLRTATEFVEGLTPRDHVALITFPEPGPRVDFTTDRARVQRAMETIVGQPAKLSARQLSIQTWEALALDLESIATNTFDGPLGPIEQRILERGCNGQTREDLPAEELQACRRAVQQEAMMMRLEIRQETNFSVSRLESYLEELTYVEGPKSMVLISAGLVIEDLSLLAEVARLAAAARTTIHVLAVEPRRNDEFRGLPNGQSTMALQDRSLQLSGLETVADRTGGVLYRAEASGDGAGIFERIASELSAWYVVAVKREPEDPDEQRVEVDVHRRGVTTRSTRTFVATAAVNARRPREDVLSEALSSPIAIPEVLLRLSTFAQREPDTDQYRLHVAAQVGQPGTPPGEYSVGYVLMDEDRLPVTSLGRQLRLTPGSDAPEDSLHFDTALLVDPGLYSLRFGVVDAEGRRGSVVRRVELGPAVPGELQASDLIVGKVPEEGEVMHPAVEPQVGGGRVAGYLELYPPPIDTGELTVRLEIAEGESTPALATRMLNIGPAASAATAAAGAWRVASGVVEADLLPGRYLARATILRAGEPLRVVSRPFVLRPNDPPPDAAAARGEPISSLLRGRTAAYVGTVVGGLSNIVAQEDFSLSDPVRRVRSDFLLVRYPGSERDLLTFRDVIQVNEAPVEGRPERLEELFLRPFNMVAERVRQITSAAGEHVPSVLNPIFVLAFLQADFQSRFELTVSDAGEEWPRQVKAVSFEETARPTLLRVGLAGNQDLPSRGTAWIEEGTGRILQTELRLGRGGDEIVLTTRFRLDDRLQIMVPEWMRTQHPTGVAIYSNFRRFTVATETVIPVEQAGSAGEAPD